MNKPSGVTHHGFFRFASLSSLASAVSALKGLAYAAVLGPEAFGVYSAVDISLALGLYLGTCGVVDGASRMVPVALGAGDEAGARRLMSEVFGAQLAISATVLAGTLLTMAFLPGVSGSIGIALAVGALALMSNAMTVGLMAASSFGEFVTLGRLMLSRAAVTLMLGMLAGCAFGIFGILAVEATVALCIAIWSMFLSPFSAGISWPTLGVLRVLLIEGLPILLTNLMQMLTRYLERAFVGLVLGLEALGQFAFGSLVLTAGVLCQGILIQYLLPSLARAYGAGQEHKQALRLVDRWTIIVVSLGIGGYLPFLIVLWWIRPWYGGGFVRGLELMQIIYLGAVFQAAQLYPALFISQGSTWPMFRRAAFTAAITLGACVAGSTLKFDIVFYAWVITASRLVGLIMQRLRL